MPEQNFVGDRPEKKRRRRKKNKNNNNNNPNIDNNIPVTDNSGISGPKSEKTKKKRKSRLDRYYGRFCCRVCRRCWDSAFVFTRAGTKKVLFKQRCMMCDGPDAWMFPYALEILRCSVCQSEVCECTCDDCNKLKHQRYTEVKNDPSKRVTRTVDHRFKYCKCEERQKAKGVGANINLKKPHMAQLCQRCQSGKPCTQAPMDQLEDQLDNLHISTGEE